MQQYRWFIVNSVCWLMTTVSTCFGHLYAHHQEKRPRVTAYGVYLLVVLDVAGCGTVVLRWGCEHCEGCCSSSNLHRRQPEKIFGCCKYVANKGVKGRQVLLVRVLTTRSRLAGRVVTMKKHGMRDFVVKRV